MKPSPEYIYQLMTEKLAGVINAMDEHYLDELIESVPAVREKWQEVQSILSAGSEIPVSRGREWPATAELLDRRSRPPAKQLQAKILPLYRQLAAAAAGIAAALVLGWGLYDWLGPSPERRSEAHTSE